MIPEEQRKISLVTSDSLPDESGLNVETKSIQGAFTVEESR